MVQSNKSLGKAKGDKMDEFYTWLPDIEQELAHYRKHFKDKVVLCNCDDPFESAFFAYFVLNFEKLGLAKLICTCYQGSLIAGTQLSLFDVVENVKGSGHAYKAVVTKVYDTDGNGLDMDDIKQLFVLGENELVELEGDGDFRSDECMALLDEADIVVTNPPFSLFRDFAKTLVDHNKKFLIIGPYNGRKYAETFPLVRDGKMWLGLTNPKRFFVPDYYTKGTIKVDENGRRYTTQGNVNWYTNLDYPRRHNRKILVDEYDPERYPTYTNFDGIDVESANDIPCDWAGYMGVPINMLDEFNPDQFEIIGLGEGNLAKEIGITRNHEGRTKLEVQDPDGTFRRPYARIVIRNKNPKQSED